MGTHSKTLNIENQMLCQTQGLQMLRKTSLHWNPSFQIPKCGGLVWGGEGWYWGGQVWGGWSLLPIWPRSVREKVWCSIHMRSWPGARATVGRQALLKRLSYALHDHSGCVSRYRQKDDREKRSEALTLNLQRKHCEIGLSTMRCISVLCSR